MIIVQGRKQDVLQMALNNYKFRKERQERAWA
jgi:hypothetical protein